MTRPMTELQRAFVEWCIASSKFEIVKLMSISVVSFEASNYNALSRDIILGKYGFCDSNMVEIGRSLFPDPIGSTEGAGFDEAYDMVCTALDEWLSGFDMPLEQVSFPPDQ